MVSWLNGLFREKKSVALLLPAALPAAYLAFQAYKRYKWYRWGYEPGAISGYFAKLLEKHSKRRRKEQPIRVYMDGCFDMFHYGHANAIRQARACGDYLVLGVVPDEEVIMAKGPPVMNEDERLCTVEAVRWVDEVMPGVPYEITEEFMTELFEKHKIDFIVHGDDPCLLPDGTDAYAAAKRVNRFVTIKRTEGVSSTDIVGRMLMCTRASSCTSPNVSEQKTQLRTFSQGLEALEEGGNEATSVSHFLPTSRRFVQFSSGKKPAPGDRIVYLDGAFDMFHAGHVEILKQAKSLGDFLLVGIHRDEVITAHRGPHQPILGLHERSLSVLACKYADEVIIGAPFVVTKDLLITFNINLVVHGTHGEKNFLSKEEGDPYAVPKDLGLFQTVESPRLLTTGDIIKRVVDNRAAYEARNEKKNKSQANYYEQKSFVEEL